LKKTKKARLLSIVGTATAFANVEMMRIAGMVGIGRAWNYRPKIHLANDLLTWLVTDIAFE